MLYAACTAGISYTVVPGSSLLPKQFSKSREIKIEEEWLSTRKINFAGAGSFQLSTAPQYCNPLRTLVSVKGTVSRDF